MHVCDDNVSNSSSDLRGVIHIASFLRLYFISPDGEPRGLHFISPDREPRGLHFISPDREPRGLHFKP